MPINVVIADANISRRQGAAEQIATKANLRECVDRTTLLQILMEETPAVAVIGALGSCPSEVVEAAHTIRSLQPETRVIIISDHSSEAIVLGALRAGVFDYLKAPVDSMEIAEAVFRAFPVRDDASGGFEDLVGCSEPIREVKGLIRRIAPLNSTVLITGESGTGKEIVARLLHKHSRRADGQLVCVNCAALPDSLIESELFGHERGAFTGAVTRQIGHIQNADGGTLFLDEIGDMGNVAQSKVLRALEQREVQPLGSTRAVPVDIRLITATHCDLEKYVDEGRFRADLFYRLDISRIHLPPLRERPEDVPMLAAHFIRMMNRGCGRQVQGLTPAALEELTRHEWPGNVRQLRNVIEAAAAMCVSEWISDRDLLALHSFSASVTRPMRTTAAATISTRQVKPGRDALLEALEATHWNMTRTAELLRWSRSTLYRNVARYKIERNIEEPEPSS